MHIPCCMDVSRGTAYGLLVSQVLFTLACILYSPKREITVYTLKTPTNTTQLQTYENNVHVQLMFGALSLLAFFFSMQTMQYSENDINNYDYNAEFVDNNFLWNSMFWVYCFGSHLILIGIVMQTADLYCLILTAFLTYYTLYLICLPRHETPNLTRDNLFMLGYAGAIAIVYANSQKQDLIVFIVLLDYCLGIGHTWDKQATLDTIVNCRLFYICCQSLLLCIYYCWI